MQAVFPQERRMAFYQFALDNFAALLLGALIGLERQWRQRNADLRTNALVAFGGVSIRFPIFIGDADK